MNQPGDLSFVVLQERTPGTVLPINTLRCSDIYEAQAIAEAMHGETVEVQCQYLAPLLFDAARDSEGVGTHAERVRECARALWEAEKVARIDRLFSAIQKFLPEGEDDAA